MQLDKEKLNITDNLDFFAHQVVEGFLTGMHKSPYHGFSVEFAEHRLYNNGDSIKNIDWKLFARSDKLFVKKSFSKISTPSKPAFAIAIIFSFNVPFIETVAMEVFI